MTKVLSEIHNLTKEFTIGKKSFKAVRHFNLQIFSGETVGLVGESGSGKSTVGRLLLGLMPPTSGKVIYDGLDLHNLNKKQMHHFRRRAQMIFQDPFSSLNPRMTVQDIIGEPLDIHRIAKGNERKKRIEELLFLVGLNNSCITRFPHEFSGGQRQRIGIARALAVSPQFIVCDEPISSLDVSIQAQIVNLLKRLQIQMGLTYLFISHDLSVVKYISDRVAVMYLGQLMELSSCDALYCDPLHPYTQALLSSIPIPDPFIEKKRQRTVLREEIPNPLIAVSGCPFASRCPQATEKCRLSNPSLREVKKGHFAACHYL